MPHRVPLRAGDPKRVGRYVLDSRLDGLPSDDPIFTGSGPDRAQVCVSVLAGDWDGAARDRFAAEAAVAKLVPPFCAARVLDAGLEGDDAYLVSEYVPGQSLLEVVAEQGVFDGQQLEALSIGMATGLASVHQAGLVHGSFGPQYVMLPAGAPPCVVEFGITPPYGTATPSADMLAWARTVMFAATGQPPSETADLDVLPERMREPVLQCLDYEPSERPAARAVVQFLLGGGALRAGVLAEGSRRAAQGAWPNLETEQALARERDGSSHRNPQQAPPRPAVPRQRGETNARAIRQGPQPASDRARARADIRNTGPIPATQATANQQGQAQRHSGPAKPARRGRTGWLVGGAAAVVIVVVVLVVILLQSGHNGPVSASTSPPPGGRSPEPTASPSASAAVATSAFSGTWTGLVNSPLTTFNMTVSFTTGHSGGNISYTAAGGVSCSGGLDLTSVSPTQMTMKIGTTQKSCGNGEQVTVTKASPNTLSFSLAGSPPATGTLTRSP